MLSSSPPGPPPLFFLLRVDFFYKAGVLCVGYVHQYGEL